MPKKKGKRPSPVVVADVPSGTLVVNHWTITNGSGMHRVAESIAKAECALGLDSQIVDPTKPETWEARKHADVQVVHTHFPTEMYKRCTKTVKIVWMGHGTPDHVFQNTVEECSRGGYGHGDGVMLLQHWLQRADAKVTFWPRHAWIYDRMRTKGAPKTHVIPMGVDLAFWKGHVSDGKFAGAPSIFTAENPHFIKWPYDLVTAWPDVVDEFPEARHHLIYLARDLHRTFFPWMNAMGASFSSFVSPSVFGKDWLRNAFMSTDYTVGLVRYGDLNHLSMEANAAGAKTISYPGNEYADFWIAEGDQRGIARELIEIFKGDRMPRKKTPVSDVSETAKAMLNIYHSIL